MESLKQSIQMRRLQLPTEPNTVAAGGDTRTLWLGPDEWLVVSSPGEHSHPAPDLARTLAPPPAHSPKPWTAYPGSPCSSSIATTT